jgi:hypothetical protein
MSVVHNTHRPEYVLKKKSNSICYDAVSESAFMGELIIGHVSYVKNPDICSARWAEAESFDPPHPE